MKVAEYRKIAEALGRFATTREKADGPEAYIGVQNKGGTLKFIAGNRVSGIVASTTDYTSSGDSTYVISARPFLQGAKVLPAKAEIEVAVSPEKLSVITAGGGKIELESRGPIGAVGFPKRPKGMVAQGNIEGRQWKRMSKMFKYVSAKVEVPSVQHVDGRGYATAVSPGERSRYVSHDFPASGPDSYNMAAYRDFWEGLSALSEDGTILWGHGGIEAVAGGIICFSAPYLVSKWDAKKRTAEEPKEVAPWPILRLTGNQDVTFSIPRKNLIDIVRGQAPFDEQNRVTLDVGTDSLRVTPFGDDGGQEVTVVSEGQGARSVNAEYLTGLLSNMDSKEVTLGWSAGQPAIAITSEDYENWAILLAPVAL